jgi:hypothetical protein
VGGLLNGEHKMFRAFYPERVTRVHRINKTLTNIQKAKNNGV